MFLLASLVYCSPSGKMQQPGFDLDEIIQKGNFTFYAETAYPSSMPSRPLIPPDQMVLKNDTLEATMSYFGNSHSVTQNQRGGITFKTTDFSRTFSKNSKGEWTVDLEVKNEPSAQHIAMNIYSDAQAVVSVSSLRRERIQFRGYIKPNGN